MMINIRLLEYYRQLYSLGPNNRILELRGILSYQCLVIPRITDTLELLFLFFIFLDLIFLFILFYFFFLSQSIKRYGLQLHDVSHDMMSQVQKIIEGIRIMMSKYMSTTCYPHSIHICYDSMLKMLSKELTLILSDTRELDRVPNTKQSTLYTITHGPCQLLCTLP